MFKPTCRFNHQYTTAMITVVVFLIGGLSMSAQSNADFYVAPTGNDKAPGTLSKPFASLQRARDAVRASKQANPDKDYVVMLRGGYYRLSETVVFGLQDSATGGRTITYTAHPGEKPVIEKIQGDAERSR